MDSILDGWYRELCNASIVQRNDEIRFDAVGVGFYAFIMCFLLMAVFYTRETHEKPWNRLPEIGCWQWHLLS